MNIHKNLYYPCDIQAVKDDTKYTFYIQLKSIMDSKPDVVLGCYEANFWIRLGKACKKDFTGYASEAELLKAIKLSLSHHGFKKAKLVTKV